MFSSIFFMPRVFQFYNNPRNYLKWGLRQNKYHGVSLKDCRPDKEIALEKWALLLGLHIYRALITFTKCWIYIFNIQDISIVEYILISVACKIIECWMRNLSIEYWYQKPTISFGEMSFRKMFFEGFLREMFWDRSSRKNK